MVSWDAAPGETRWREGGPEPTHRPRQHHGGPGPGSCTRLGRARLWWPRGEAPTVTVDGGYRNGGDLRTWAAQGGKKPFCWGARVHDDSNCEEGGGRGRSAPQRGARAPPVADGSVPPPRGRPDHLLSHRAAGGVGEGSCAHTSVCMYTCAHVYVCVCDYLSTCTRLGTRMCIRVSVPPGPQCLPCLRDPRASVSPVPQSPSASVTLPQ